MPTPTLQGKPWPLLKSVQCQVPIKTDQRCMSIYFDKGDVSEIDWKLIPSSISVSSSQKILTTHVNTS